MKPKITIIALTALLVTATVSFMMIRSKETPLDPVGCMERIPKHVKGLKILQGPRTERSIIRDMVPIVCNARVLFQKMQPEVKSGSVLFKVWVEYPGETMKVEIVETTIESKEFLRKVSNFIMSTDFISWARHDDETIFLYPMEF